MLYFWCIPLSSDVREIDWDVLIARQQEHTNGQLFDVITCDPPWQLSSANPTRGVAIAYETLNDGEILKIPWGRLQKDGFLFIWVINAKYRFALDMMGAHGYRVVDEIQWVKQTCNGKIAKGHGYYLQHAKEVCLVGCKGDPAILAKKLREEARVRSQKRFMNQLKHQCQMVTIWRYSAEEIICIMVGSLLAMNFESQIAFYLWIIYYLFEY